jgi:phosphoribosylformimino-5-aminoimidazole carboxamide ribonucleotide (ProFAR) isomerase
VVKLGPGCDEAAVAALQTWPGELQIGGGVDDTNARGWIEKGAKKVQLSPTIRILRTNGMSGDKGDRNVISISGSCILNGPVGECVGSGGRA